MSQSQLNTPTPQREHSVETIRRNSEVMGNLRKLMVVNRGVSFIWLF
jgi:pyruvate carboxylase